MNGLGTQTHNGTTPTAFGERQRMPNTRRSVTHHFQVGEVDGTIIAGVRDDGTLGEIFLHNVGKQGSTIDGFIQAFAITFSVALQYGASVDDMCKKLAHMKFEPAGHTVGIPEIPKAPSIIAYICRWLVERFGSADLAVELRSDCHV